MTKQQIDSAMQIVLAVADTVKEAGPLGAPKGPMYMAFMAKGLSLTDFNACVGLLVKQGVVRESNDCLFSLV